MYFLLCKDAVVADIAVVAHLEAEVRSCQPLICVTIPASSLFRHCFLVTMVMSLPSISFRIAQLIYPLPSPPKERTKELRVLCLGLPRSATESLHNALQILDYDGVSHGIPWWLHHPEHSVKYTELALLSQQGRTPNVSLLRSEFFDRVLGDVEATTDIPSVWFAEELLSAYPDARVILNRRTDVGAWKTSFRDSVLPVLQSWEYWFWSWFDAELFWLMSLTYHMHTRKLFEGDFEANAADTYRRHYENLERELEEAKRPYLKWSVEDGW